MTLILETIKANKWLAYLALLLALVHAFGNVIISGFAYMQPKVTLTQQIINKSQVTDRTNTKRSEIVRPDGTIEKLEEIQTAIDSLNFRSEDKSEEKTPVPLSLQGGFAYGLGYAPLSRSVDVKLGYWFTPSLAAEFSHPVFSFGDSLQLAPLAPVIWATWRP